MIAIPNMDKPKSCYNHCLEGFIANEEIGCPLKDYAESHQYKNGIHPDCPLIEIVRCGECKYSDIIESTGQTECLARRGYWFIVDPTGFCSYGERREE